MKENILEADRATEPHTYITISSLEKLGNEIERLQEQLDIAVKGLKFISSQCYGKDMYDCAKGTLKQLEELDK